MYSNLYTKANYVSGIHKFIHSSYISEYDLSKANISALFYANYITEQQYLEFYHMEKSQREILIGMMERDHKEITEIKANGIMEARRLLFEMNNIQDDEVLEIRNDAVFVVGKQLDILQVHPYFEFKLKGVFTNYAFCTNQLSIFYNFDPINQVDTISVKGIKDSKLQLHDGYFLRFICDVFFTLQTDSAEASLRLISEYYKNFVEGNLHINNYRAFDSYSVFYVKAVYNKWSLDYLEDTMANRMSVDKSINLYIIRVLYGYLSTYFFNRKKG